MQLVSKDKIITVEAGQSLGVGRSVDPVGTRSRVHWRRQRGRRRCRAAKDEVIDQQLMRQAGHVDREFRCRISVDAGLEIAVRRCYVAYMELPFARQRQVIAKLK